MWGQAGHGSGHAVRGGDGMTSEVHPLPVLGFVVLSLVLVGGLVVLINVIQDECDVGAWGASGSAPEGCYPCTDAMDYHATAWANGEGNASWHLERRAHWEKARAMFADCSDWREADAAAQEEASGGDDAAWHLERYMHWHEVRALDLSCEGWEDADARARNQTGPAKIAGPEGAPQPEVGA